MNSYTPIKVGLVLFFGSLLSPDLSAQVVATQATASDAVTALTGSGIATSNITFTGDARQLGTFTKTGTATTAPNLDFDDGIILSTGKVSDCTAANHGPSEGTDMNGTTGDADLALLGATAIGAINDPAILEFDFVPDENFINFDFQFATEEQESDCNAGFADLMGFFLSGPGISGPYSNNAINLAVIPNTTTPVGICTINASTNSQYYTDNGYHSSGIGGGNAHNLEYETIVDAFTASYNNLQCGETYHIKIAIADDSDHILDAVVFIEEGSFKSPSSINGLTYPNPVCENQVIAIGVDITGSTAGYTYAWETGETTQSISSVVRADNKDISVTVTSPTGCETVLTANLEIHGLDNVPSYTSGYDQSWDFNYTVNAGDILIQPIYGHDSDPFDVINMTWNSGISGASFTVANNNTLNPMGLLSWVPGINQIGMHYFTVTTVDSDLCGSNTTVSNYSVRVICPDCEDDIYIQNRRSATVPLLPLTEAGGNIFAGSNVTNNQAPGIVNLTGTGSQITRFSAGYQVQLYPGFSADATSTHQFHAGINIELCIDPNSCFNCCNSWTGFTIDTPLDNVFSPDGDGINDVWMALDADNPYCAYNCVGYDFRVFNRWGNEVYKDISFAFPGTCCQYVSPAIPTAQNPASIHWNGENNSGNMLVDGTYFIVLELFGCNGSNSTFNQDVLLLNGGGTATSKTGEDVLSSNEEVVEPKFHFRAFPNPTTDGITVSTEKEVDYNLVNESGQVLREGTLNAGETTIDLSELPRGVYILHAGSDHVKLIKSQ